MIQVSQLTKSFSGRTLFEDITFAIGKGERVGLVGRNGSGKSTLFRVLLGEETYDSGDIVRPKGYKVGHLSQHIHFTKDTLLEECCQVLPEHQKYDHYRAEKILFGLGFDAEDMEKPPSIFSGGYQLRINLAKALLQDPDLIFLDEPTNYLDIVSVRWLKQFLNSFRGEALIITHDRDFMDSVTTHTMGLHRKGLLKVQGSTSKYYDQLMLTEEIYEKTRLNQEKKLKEMQRFVDRFRAKASKASAAQSKLKQIKKLEVLSKLNSELTLGFRFNFKPTPAKVLLEVKDLAFSYSGGSDDLLFSDIRFRVKPEDRIAIVGKNGKGKSTLLNVIAGGLKPVQGNIKSHPETSMGYYRQTNSKNLNPKASIIDEISSVNVDLSYTAACGICGAMMFPGEDAKKKIGVLSGGEQGRVLLGKILATPSNLLLLDEPSNHLDMESIEVMVEEVDSFPGGVLIVTHNEDILRRLANKLIVFRKGGAEIFLGTYDEFLENIGWEEDEGDRSNSGQREKLGRKERKRQRAEIVKERSKVTQPLKKEISSLEKSLQTLETQLEEKNQSVAELISSPEESHKMQDLYKEIGQIQIKIEQSYTRLEALTSDLDKASQKYDDQLSELQD